MEDQVGRGPCPKCFKPKTYEDGIAEGLERAARYHEAQAGLHDSVSERAYRDSKLRYSALANAHRADASAIRKLKEK